MNISFLKQLFNYTLGAQRLFMRSFRFGKVFIVTHVKRFFFLRFFRAASPLVTSTFGQRTVGLQPTPKHSNAREKNPLVPRVRFNTTLSQYLVF